MTRTSTTTRALSVIAGAVIGAAIWTSTALAEHPDNRAGMRGVGAVASASADTTRPDDRGEARGPGVFSRTPIATPAVVDEFEWSDASIGAGAALLGVLLGAGAIAVRRDRRRVSIS